MIEIKIDEREINQVKAKLGEFSKRSHVVIYRAVNRTLASARADIAKQASLRYIIKQKTIKDSLSTKKATGNNPVGIITSKGNPIPLSNFDVTPKRERKQFKNGNYSPAIYKARVLNDGSTKGIPRMFFVKDQMLQRPIGASREENKNIKNWLKLALSVPQMIGNKKVYDVIQKNSTETLRKRINHEVEYELRRLKQ